MNTFAVESTSMNYIHTLDNLGKFYGNLTSTLNEVRVRWA